MRLLLAEDEESLSEALAMILRRNGYQVETVNDGQAAIEAMERDSYDAAVLDIMMPKADGIAVLKAIRAKGDLTPILMLTAKSEIDDKVTGLEAGANDYLTKPFHSRELMARIKAMTRAQSFQNHPKLSCGNTTLDRESFELSTPAGALRLTNKEFLMLEMMMSNPGRKISKERFTEKIWGEGKEAELEMVEMYISYLQRKLQILHSDIKIEKKERNIYWIKA